jgi:hypothetical protein
VSDEKKGSTVAKVPAKPVPSKTTANKKTAPKKVVKKVAVVAEPEIPILMRPSVAKDKKPKKLRLKGISSLKILFHINSASAFIIASVNAVNGGLIAVTMLLVMMAVITEILATVFTNPSEINAQVAKYRAFFRKIMEKKKNVA